LNDDGSVNKFPNGSFPTGDLGYRDSDGYIFITGRKKDLIIRGGINISPMEISNRLMEHPNVKEAATIGVPDNIYGEVIVSFVVLKLNSNTSEEMIKDHCREKLPDFKIPKAICFLKEIPKTKTGKFSKHALQKMISDHKNFFHVNP
jgi:long-chain acyl-CoA synthetase